MNRRDFLKNAGARNRPRRNSRRALECHSPAAGEIARTVDPCVPPITAVIYDERYADCRAFRRALVRRSAPKRSRRSKMPSSSGTARSAPISERIPAAWQAWPPTPIFRRRWACGRELRSHHASKANTTAAARKQILTHRLRAAGDDSEIAAAVPGADAPWAESTRKSTRPLAESTRERVRSKSRATATTRRSPGNPGYLAPGSSQ